MPARSIPIHDPDFWTGDFWPDLAWLRANEPVHRVDTPAGTVWALSRWADVMAVSRDQRTWRSGRGILIDDLRRPVSGDESVIYLDPPEHARHRKLVSGWFKPSTVRSFEQQVRALAIELIDALPRDEVFDANEALAVPLPIRVIARMLGVPADDQARFREWSDQVIADGSSQEVGNDVSEGVIALYTYFGEFLAARRDAPGDDLLSTLVEAELDGHRLTEHEMLAFCMTLLVAGNETTRNLIANGLLALAENPEQWKRLQVGEVTPAQAVEELLRWVTPVLHFARTAGEPTTLAGHEFGAGDMVVMLYASANRDADVFGDTADVLDLGRDPNPHVAFGFGEHFCLGAQLARLEGRIVLEALLERAGSFEVGGSVVRRRGNLMRGVASLPMVLRSP